MNKITIAPLIKPCELPTLCMIFGNDGSQIGTEMAWCNEHGLPTHIRPDFDSESIDDVGVVKVFKTPTREGVWRVQSRQPGNRCVTQYFALIDEMWYRVIDNTPAGAAKVRDAMGKVYVFYDAWGLDAFEGVVRATNPVCALKLIDEALCGDEAAFRYRHNSTDGGPDSQLAYWETGLEELDLDYNTIPMKAMGQAKGVVSRWVICEPGLAEA